MGSTGRRALAGTVVSAGSLAGLVGLQALSFDAGEVGYAAALLPVLAHLRGRRSAQGAGT